MIDVSVPDIPYTAPLTEPRKYIGFDSEASLMSETDPVPEMVCSSWHADGQSWVFDKNDSPSAFRHMATRALRTRETLVAHFARYDLSSFIRIDHSLIPLIFELLDAGLVECTYNNEKLHAIATGDYWNEGKCRMVYRDGANTRFGMSIGGCTEFRRGYTIEKENTWRLRYGELKDIPLSQWPADAKQYAADDARDVHALRVYEDEDEAIAPTRPGYYCYADAPAQARSDFALQMMRWVGVRTDPEVTQRVRAKLQVQYDASFSDLVAWGFVRPAYVRPKAGDVVMPSVAQKVIKEYIEKWCSEHGTAALLNASGKAVSLAAADLAAYDDDKLKKYVFYKKAEKTIGYTRILDNGFNRPIHSEPNNLVENGRTSWGSDNEESTTSEKTLNLQQLPTAEGVRECFIPPAGHWLWSIDYAMLELCTVAQACLWLFGKSRLADMINEGADLHSALAIMFLRESGVHVSPEEFAELKKQGKSGTPLLFGQSADEIRDAAKRANFGFWGGMGVDKFMRTNYKIKLPKSAVVKLKDIWKALFPETRPFFGLIGSIADKDKQIVQLTSGRIRRKNEDTFCSLANSTFSGLAADGSKHAMYLITKACYAEPDSPLYGSRPNAFVHDEFQGYSAIARASAAVQEAARIAEQSMQARIPDVKIKCSKALMLRLRKGALDTRDADNNVIPFELGEVYRRLVAEGKVTI